MSEFFKAELKDKFLQYASDRDDYFEVQLLYDEFLRPNYSLNFIERLLREILEYDPDLIDVMSGNGSKIFMISSTGLTEEFIETGGFKHLFLQEEEKWDTFLDQLANTRKLSNEEKQNLGKTEKASYRRERTFLYGLIGAVALSFVFTLFSLFNALFDNDKYISQQEFEERIQKLKNELNPENSEVDSLFRKSVGALNSNDSIKR